MHLRQTNSWITLLCVGVMVLQAMAVPVLRAYAVSASPVVASPEVTYARTKQIMETASQLANESAEAVQKLQTFSMDEDFATETIRKYTASIISMGDMGEYLDLDEETTSNLSLTMMQLEMPVKNGAMSSPYGWRNGRQHKGIDFSAPYGSPIQAAQEGRVVFSGWYYGYGYLVTIEHVPGIRTRYAHCSSLLVKTGQYVKRGQAIARVGSTGHSTGPHLHFELMASGVNIDPENYMIGSGLAGHQKHRSAS